MNPFGYSEAVWRLFSQTPRAGSLPAADSIRVTAATKANRSLLRLHVKMSGPQVADARFQAYGCPTTIAVGAYLAEQIVGRSPDELARLRAPEIRQALEIPEDRIHCALLGEDAVKSLLSEVAAR